MASGLVETPVLELDPSQYTLTPEEIDFLKAQTGIKDDEELKIHVLSVQKDAWNVHKYMCIQRFGFTRLRICRLPPYSDLLKISRERDGAIYLDFACCLGTDARKVISDGFPSENVVTSDLQPAFWELGHKLFKTTPDSLPVRFVPGDVFDPLHIAPAKPLYTPPTTPRPVLSMLTSLTPLQGHVSAIHVTAFFHLFNEEQQLSAARALASLLSPVPDSVIFGAHTSQPDSGARLVTNMRGEQIYCHSPQSWIALWDGVVFEKGTVNVTAEITEIGLERKDQRNPEGVKHYRMIWCVKRT